MTDLSEKEWDLLQYEEQLCYHNSVTRQTSKFLNPLNKSSEPVYESKGLFNDYDSIYLVKLVIEFIQGIGESVNEKNVKKIIDFILDNMSNKRINLLTKKAGF